MGIATLQDVLGGVPEAEFRARLESRTLTLWRDTGADRLTSLVDWAALERLLEAGGFPADELRVTRDGTPVRPELFVSDGRPDAGRIRQLLGQGVSLIFFPLDAHLPAIDALLAHIRAGTRDRVRGGAIVTTGGGGAFPLHYDAEDLLIVQVEGVKRWLIHRTPVVNPVRGMGKPHPPLEENLIDETLHPGDLMLLPAGYWHRCENGPGRSVHLGLFFVPPSLPRAADALRRRLLATPGARAPLTRGPNASPAIDEAGVRARLIEEIDRMSLDDFFGGEPGAP